MKDALFTIVFGCLLVPSLCGQVPEDSDLVAYEMVPPPKIPEGYFDKPVGSLQMMSSFRRFPEKVALLVDSELYPDFETDIHNYQNDVEAHFDLSLLVYHDKNYRRLSFERVREELQEIHRKERISGAVLVGFFPIMQFHVPGQGLKPMGQMIGYEDLDGQFTDDGYYSDSGSGMVFHPGKPDGVYDHHRWNNNGLEIWCAMVRPYQSASMNTLYTTSVRTQLHDFFARSHAYYNKQTVVPQRGLAYVNKDWKWDGDDLEKILSQTYGDWNSVAYYGGRNCGYWFMEELSSGFEVTYLYSHSASWFHQFDRGMWHDVSNKLFQPKNGRGSVITYGFNCHGADYLETPTGCMGQRYVFGSELGQAYVGCMISTGVIGIIEQARMLQEGEYLGKAFFKALNAAYESNQGFYRGKKHHTCWAQTILGNPFVTASALRDLSAVPASISGQVIGGLDVRLTVLKENRLVAITESQNSQFHIANLCAGDYIVLVETPAGDLVEIQPVSLSSGQTLTSWDIALPSYGEQTNRWYYFHLTEGRHLPSDWNSATADMSRWDGQGPSPVGYDEEVPLRQGTGIHSAQDESGRVYLRKDFNIDDLGHEQRVWAYATTQNSKAPELWVNGKRVTLSRVEDRTDLTYWQYRGDITTYIQSQNNYIVAYGQRHLDLSAPVYRTDDLSDENVRSRR